MKYFGQYLVEQKIISNEVLVDALLEQQLPLPTTFQQVRKKNLISAEHILKALEVQSELAVDFKQACQRLGFWSSEIAHAIIKEIDEIRIPLGQILLKNGSINLNTLTKALDDFLSNDQNLIQPRSHSNASDQTENNREKPTSPETKIDAAIVETHSSEGNNKDTIVTKGNLPPSIQDPLDNLQFNTINRSFVDEYQTFFSSEKNIDMNNLFATLASTSSTKQSPVECLNILLREIHTLKGLAIWTELSLTTLLLNSLETAIILLISIPLPGSELLAQFSNLGLNTFSVLDELKRDILENSSEKSFFERNKGRIKQLVLVLSTFKESVTNIS